MKRIRGILPEIWITCFSLIVMGVVSGVQRLPIIYPSGERAAFVGIHYLYPLAGIAILGIITYFGGRRETAARFMIALPCYVVVLFVHFNFKLWIPHINPSLFDSTYWWIDQKMVYLVDIFSIIAEILSTIIPKKSNFYMISFMFLFYCSFCYHSLKTPEIFGRLVVSVLLLQAFGTIAYLIAPAIGPFVYEPGLDPMISKGQAGMLEFYQNSVAVGPQWLEENGSLNFTAGLAAMPSLHTAGAFLFFLFAARFAKPLLPLYSFILFYIVIMAVASRWHYLIDLPVGMLIAWISFRLAARLDRKSGNSTFLVEGDSKPAIA